MQIEDHDLLMRKYVELLLALKKLSGDEAKRLNHLDFIKKKSSQESLEERKQEERNEIKFSQVKEEKKQSEGIKLFNE